MATTGRRASSASEEAAWAVVSFKDPAEHDRFLERAEQIASEGHG